MQTSLNLTESLSYERNLNSFDQQLKTNNMYCSTPILKTDKTDISLLSSKRIVSAADFDNDPDFSVTDVWEKKVSEKEEKNNELNLEKEEGLLFYDPYLCLIFYLYGLIEYCLYFFRNNNTTP